MSQPEHISTIMQRVWRKLEMPSYDNSGALFQNARKEHDKQPDFNGSIMVQGIDCWLAGWKRTDKNGNEYYSLKATPKEDGFENIKDDDVPF